MTMPEHWSTEDGLELTREGAFWRVRVARDLPERLGKPEMIELPTPGASIAEGDVLLAVELAKARVEFRAPSSLTIAEVAPCDPESFMSGVTSAHWILLVKMRDNQLGENDSRMVSNSGVNR